VFIAADENSPPRDCGRGENHLTDGVGTYHFVRRPGFDDECVAVFARQKDFAVEGHGGRAEAGWRGHAAAFVFDLAGPGLDTG